MTPLQFYFMMFAYFLIFSMPVISLLVVDLHFLNQPILAQPTTSTYENTAVGLRFEYPEWELRETPIGLRMTPDEDSVFTLEIVSLDRLGIPNPTLKDYAQYQYPLCCGTMSTPVNDNQTTIGKNYTAMQYEYTFEGVGTRQGLEVWAINNGIGYQFEYISNQGSDFSENIPAIRKVLDSVEFIPIEEEKPKQPSFMQ
jgi:hypothetical protein